MVEGVGDYLGPYLLGPNDVNQGIYTGDARELARVIPDESVDLIFTDPVYQNIDDYRWLAETAARVLKPDSACLVWSGVKWLGECITAMAALQYRWTLIWWQTGKMNWPWDYIYYKWTPIIWMELGKTKPARPIQDIRQELSTANSGNHRWGKLSSVISYYLGAFAPTDSVILDPFTGGGTMAAVCKMLGRRWLAFEIDTDTANDARRRVQMTQAPLFVMQEEQMTMELEPQMSGGKDRTCGG